LLSRTFALGIFFTSEKIKSVFLPEDRKTRRKIISAHLGRTYSHREPAVFGNRCIISP